MKGKIEDLFELAGYSNYRELEVNKFYEPKRNIEIASFENGKKVFKKVNAIVYKGMCKDGFVINKSFEDGFKVTPLHKVYDYLKKDFVEVGKIWEEKVNSNDTFHQIKENGNVIGVIFDGINENGEQIRLQLTKCTEEFPVLDLEVAETHTYFSQGILSHNTFGSGAKANGTVIKRMNYFVDRYNCPVFWISQERANQSPMAHLNALTGGYAVNFYPSTRFRVTAKEPILKNGEIVGIKIKIKNYKNKTGIPNRECFLDVYFHDGPDYKAGIDGEGQYLDMLLELGMIKQHGAWYYYREDDPDPTKIVKCQGWGGVQNWFKENPDEFAKIKEMVNAKMSGFDETLDKNSVETSELEEIKKEISEKQEQLKENTEMLAEQALAASETAPEEDPVA